MDYYENWDTRGFPGEFIFSDSMCINDYYMDERWKQIQGFEDYFVSNKGRVWSKRSNQFLALKHMDDHDHLGVCLYKNGKRYYRYIHRLVADAFIPNPNHFPIVRHIHDNPQFNSEEDLSWGTTKDNIHDCARNGHAYFLSDEDREKSYTISRTPIKAINLYTGEETIYNGQGIASRALGIPQANIWKVLNGLRPKAQGYTFKYLGKGCTS